MAEKDCQVPFISPQNKCALSEYRNPNGAPTIFQLCCRLAMKRLGKSNDIDHIGNIYFARYSCPPRNTSLPAKIKNARTTKIQTLRYLQQLKKNNCDCKNAALCIFHLHNVTSVALFIT